MKRLAEIQAETLRLQQEKEALEEQLKAKYQPRIKEQKDVISVQEYELEKLEQQYQKDMLDLDDWKRRRKPNVPPSSGNWRKKSSVSPRNCKRLTAS